MILPDAVMGTSSTNWMARGILYAARCSRQWAISSAAVTVASGLQYDVGLGEFALGVVGNSGDRGEGDVGMHAQDTFQFSGVDVEAGGQDHVGLAVDDGEVTVVVHRGDVAGMQPSVAVDRRVRRRLVAVVAVHHHGPAEHEFTTLARTEDDGCVVDVDDAHRVSRVRDTDGAGLVGPDNGVGAGGTGEFGHPPDLVDRASGARGELDRLGRGKCLAADPAAREAGQVCVVEIRMGEQVVVRGGDAVHQRCPMLGDGCHHGLGVEAGHHDQRRPRKHRSVEDTGSVDVGQRQ